MPSTTTAPLLSRSPRSRKSLIPPNAISAPAVKRKRPHSIAPGEHLKRPPKGILKPSNQADDDVSQAYGTYDDSTTTDFRAVLNDSTAVSRKSLTRRVSFAAHAHVRVFESAEQNTNGSESPAESSPGPSASSDPQSPEDASRRARPRPIMHVSPPADSEQGEESMDLSQDGIPPPAYPPSPGSDSDQDEDGDMSLTDDFGPGIIARRRTLSMVAGERRKSSRLRTSISAPSPSEGGEEAMEFTVALDRPPPPETDAFKALRAMANANANASADADASVEMDVTTALTRLMHVRNSMGGAGPAPLDDSFSSTEESFDDGMDHTINVTKSFREAEDDVTMSAASVVAAPISVRLSQQPPPAAPITAQQSPPSPGAASIPALPTTVLPLPAFKPVLPLAVPSPSKIPIPIASRADPQRKVTPQSLKRPPPPPPQSPSPNKRRAVSVNGERVPVPAVSPKKGFTPAPVSTKKSLPIRARRPSGYFRKPSPQKPKPGSVAPSSPERPSGKEGRGTAELRSRAPQASPTRALQSSPVQAPELSPSRAPQSTTQLSPTRVLQLSPAPVTQLSSAPVTQLSPAPVTQVPSVRAPQLTPARALSARVLKSPPARAPVLSVLTPGGGHPPSPDEASPPQRIDPGAWASSVQDEANLRDDDIEPITVDNFFMMTGIRFMDDLTCPRRSTVHPSQLQRRDSREGEELSYPLSDYAIAMAVDVAQLETMSWIANDIRSAIEKYKAQYRQTEDDAAKDVPLLFREFVTAAETEREQLLYALKLIKAHTIGSAKASWYEWKRGWVQGLQANAERTLDNLDADERQLNDIIGRGGERLPALRAEYEQIMRELEQEKAAVAEIESCDQQFLAELKATIKEQKHELDVYRNDIKDGELKLARLEETLEDLEDQAGDAKAAILTAQRQMDVQKSSTRAEVFRLQDELRNVQNLHLWRATVLCSDRVEFVYDSKYTVVVPCRRFTPIAESIDVLPLNSVDDDDFPLVTQMMYRAARRHAVQGDEDKLTLKMIIQRLTNFWASYAQLRWQLGFIIIKYPLSLQLLPPGTSLDEVQGFKATATLLLSDKTSKAHVNFYFDSQMLSSWPAAASLLQFDIAVVYGNANPRVLQDAVEKRLSEVNLDENHACLVDACMEVVSQYS